MTIKSNGGIFGRNPTFNNVTVDGTLTVDQIVEKTGAAGITLDGVTLKDGSVVLANGKGIDFSATAGTGTSELFDDYEEGTWTPIDASGDGITFAAAAGLYTKVGRLVVATFRVQYPTTTSNFSVASIGGLPFTSIFGSTQEHQGSAIRYTNIGAAITLGNTRNTTAFNIFNYSGVLYYNNTLSTKTLDAAIIYQAA